MHDLNYITNIDEKEKRKISQNGYSLNISCILERIIMIQESLKKIISWKRNFKINITVIFICHSFFSLSEENLF